MAIQKQAFYEGAALHLVARTGDVISIRYEAPFFRLNDRVLAMLKYSTKSRSPWGFTFTADEQVILGEKSSENNVVLGLICGGDGVVALTYREYLKIASVTKSTIHIACYRRHGERYEINGPAGILDGKVPPSRWQRILQF
jgi:hypothetical protein